MVTVLLPAFQAAGTLDACLRSIERQTHRDWECVIVDDGSSDRTLAVAERFARRDARFRPVAAPHRGLVAALNRGLEACRGDLVARMDADDLMHRGRLAAQVAALERHPGWAAVGCHVRLFPRRQLGPGYRKYEAWLNAVDSPEAVVREAFVECPVAHPSLVVRRRHLEALRYRDRGWPEDYDLLLRLVTGGEAVGIVNERLLSWRHSANRLSRRAATYAPERFTACKAHFLARSFLARGSRYVLWGYGGTGRALRRALAPLGKHASHIVELHPGRLGNVIHGAPVVPRSELRRLPRRPLIVSVAGGAARAEIRGFLAANGFEEPADFVCAA